MAHLSPKKGGFPFKDQHDRTCPVDPAKFADYKDVLERGSVLSVDKNGYFQIAASADEGPLFLSLQDYDDLQAAMAGFFSVAKGDNLANFRKGPHADPVDPIQVHAGPAAHKALNRNTPAITGIHMDDGDVWQTDMFDDGDGVTYEIGDKLTVKDGLVTLAGDGDTVVGYVTKAPYTRYANDAVAMAGLMTGALIRVIDFQCGK